MPESKLPHDLTLSEVQEATYMNFFHDSDHESFYTRDREALNRLAAAVRSRGGEANVWSEKSYASA